MLSALVPSAPDFRSFAVPQRDVFYVSYGGWDTHASLTTPGDQFAIIDEALDSFKKEMKEQGVWENVVVLTASEFGRTLRSNGAGTDHGWAGNYFITGGDVQGGQILGKYPKELMDDSEDLIRNWRVKPSTPWEGVWYGIAQWFGVRGDEMSYVLPNVKNFKEYSADNSGELYSSKKMFGKESSAAQCATALTAVLLAVASAYSVV